MRRARDGGEYPIGVCFTADQHLGLCACGCSVAINMTSNAVRRGEKLYIAAHDPLPRTTTCAMCRAEMAESEGLFCDECYGPGTAWLRFLDSLTVPELVKWKRVHYGPGRLSKAERLHVREANR